MKRLLPCFLLLMSSAVLAESGAYRVEVIVFRNLAVATEQTGATSLEELRSFSRFPELKEIQQSDAAASEPATTAQRPDGNESPEAAPRVIPTHLPDDVRIIRQKSDQMDYVWRRLRSSKNYRPLVYGAWDQNRTDYYPPMRIHNGQLIDTQFRPPTTVVIADLAAEDPLAAYRSNFYQVDGSVQLKRSRFLHVFLDLEYRDKTQQAPAETGFFSGSNTEAEIETGNEDGEIHSIFTLKQNRQVRTNRMQYFDTPYFGALVFVSALQLDSPP